MMLADDGSVGCFRQVINMLTVSAGFSIAFDAKGLRRVRRLLDGLDGLSGTKFCLYKINVSNTNTRCRVVAGA